SRMPPRRRRSRCGRIGSTPICKSRLRSTTSPTSSMRFATAAEPLPVLVVDDDSALIRTLSDILRLHGYAPETAGTGREGLAKARHTAPALAVVDLRLPDMDGMELAAKLHALSELTEVVVLTGNASVE